MNGRLHNLTLQFLTNSPDLEQQWKHIFADWLFSAEPDLQLSFELAPQLPPLPNTPPLFVDKQDRILTVYEATADCMLLHFLDGAWIEVPLRPSATVVSGVVTNGLVASNGRFEDVIFTSLAPLLRRRGLFLVHAFAAAYGEQAALFIGASQSGKTTTGLTLLNQGWQLLTNDVALLEARADGIYAWPTPGTLGIRPNTFTLLPWLQTQLALPEAQAVEVAASQLVQGDWAVPTKVTALFFPEVVHGGETAVLSHHRAIALTQIMSESIDRWDRATLDSHINCLQQLCQQSHVYRLQLGQDMAIIPQEITRKME